MHELVDDIAAVESDDGDRILDEELTEGGGNAVLSRCTINQVLFEAEAVEPTRELVEARVCPVARVGDGPQLDGATERGKHRKDQDANKQHQRGRQRRGAGEGGIAGSSRHPVDRGHRGT